MFHKVPQRETTQISKNYKENIHGEFLSVKLLTLGNKKLYFKGLRQRYFLEILWTFSELL